MQEYAEHFDLLKDIVFNTSVKKVDRNADDTKWRLELDKSGSPETLEFDKVVFCHGYQSKMHMPVFPGQEEYTGTLMHSQEYRR